MRSAGQDGINLGEFELLEAVGSGGMGTVWHGIHRPSGTAVAVKVLTRIAARKRQLRSAFRSEIRACAGLNHPSIVTVFDRGEVPPEVEDQSFGTVRAYSPYLVMEYVDGGSLVPWCGHLTWAEIKRVLLGLLDGLAHAHARGLIHRDIKPANVLLTSDRSGIRLTDFGLVHAIERSTPGNRDRGLAGTPRYMAPEQCRGMWRDYGPWTDFYALGGLGYALASGYPPFADCQTREELTHSHQHMPPPPLEPRTPVPDGFEEWLLRMLAKNPRDRFARASEAAAELARLPDFEDLHPEQTPISDEDSIATDPVIRSGLNLMAEDETRLSTLMLEDVDAYSGHLDEDRLDSSHSGLPALPPRWQPREDQSRSDEAQAAMVATGLGLYWMRSVPMVARSRERDLLWNALRRVRSRARAEVVVIRGASGVGKSRLAQWICERGHEIGGAASLKAIHSPNNSPGSGLATMLGRQYRTLGLSYEQVQKRVARLLKSMGIRDPDEWVALAEFMAPATAASPLESTAKIRFGSKWEVLRVVQRAIERIAEDRPTCVWLDAAHWGFDGLLLVQQFLRDQERNPSPVLFVLTVQDAEMEHRRLEAGILREILSERHATEIQLGPLGRRDHERLVRHLLRLDKGLAQQVEGSTKGNPLFAVQLVGDWVDRGLLESTVSGFRIAGGKQVALPAGLPELWAARIESFLAGRPPHDGPAMELAAALGQEITEAGWYSVCEQEGLTPAADLLDRLLDDGLARSSAAGPSEGWAFAHALIRDALLARAGAGQRLRDHHLACARHLGIEGGPGSTERIARHMLAADSPHAALGMLAAGTWELIQQEELDRASALLDDFESTLDRLGLPSGDPRRGQALLLRVRLAGRSGDDLAFGKLATEAAAHAREVGWDDIVVYLGYELAGQHRRHGRLHDAWGQLDVVEGWAEERGDRPLLAGCLAEKARTARLVGDLGGAERLHRRGFDLFEQLGDGVEAGRQMVELAELAARQGDAGRAEACIQGAKDYFSNWGSRVGAAECASVRGLASCLQSDPEAAEAAYRESIARYHSLASPEVASAELGLGVVLSLERRFNEAEPLLRRAMDRFLAAGEGVLAARAHLALLPGVADSKQWSAWDQYVEAASKLVGDRGFVEEELRRCAELARQIALAADEPARAAMASALVERSEVRAPDRGSRP